MSVALPDLKDYEASDEEGRWGEFSCERGWREEAPGAESIVTADTQENALPSFGFYCLIHARKVLQLRAVEIL